MLKKIPQLLNLPAPLIVFDLETTGLMVEKDRIVELAYIIITPDGSISDADLFFNPEIIIPEEASAIHKITDQQVANAPFFREKAGELFNIFNNNYIAGYNVLNFDLPMIKNEFARAGINFEYTPDKVIDSQVIYNYMHPRTLSAAYKHYCGKEHTDAHSALADVSATAEVILGQLEKHEQIRDMSFLKKIQDHRGERFVDSEKKFFWRNGHACFNFSKYKGELLIDVARQNPGFLQWILNADFSPQTKEIINSALCGKFPQKQTE